MKLTYITLFLFSLLIISCQKNKFNIHYEDIEPDLVLNPVDSFRYEPSFYFYRPFPSDSTVEVDIDINQDGQDDYKFTYSNTHQTVSGYGQSANYNSQVTVTGLFGDNEIAVSDDYYKEVAVLQSGDVINKDNTFSDYAVIHRNVTKAPKQFDDFSGTGYIGIKLSNGEKGWIKLNFDPNSFKCTILEYAYNKYTKSQITAGQIE